MRTPLRGILVIAILVGVSGCASRPEINAAIRTVDRIWAAENQKLKRDQGTRLIRARKKLVVRAMKSTLNELGFSIRKYDRAAGLIYAVAAAPAPLTQEEWKKVSIFDESRMKEIVARTIPITSTFFQLHTDGVDVHLIVGITKHKRGSMVSFDYSVEDHKTREMGFVTMKHPGPKTAALAVEKAWRSLEVELGNILKIRSEDRRRQKGRGI